MKQVMILAFHLISLKRTGGGGAVLIQASSTLKRERERERERDGWGFSFKKKVVYHSLYFSKHAVLISISFSIFFKWQS
jgi:hypothetical protein